MDCPRCNEALTAEILKDIKFSVEVDSCQSCGGSWFEQGELSRISKIIEPGLIEIRKIPGKKEQLKALFCPSCTSKTLLEKADHPRDTRVVIDYCPECKGIWLDKGELAAIQKESWLVTMGRIFRWIAGKD